MDKQSAINLVKNTFEKSFDKDSYTLLIKNLFDSLDNQSENSTFQLHGKYIPEAYRNYIKKYERLGKYEDGNGSAIDLLIVYLKKETTLDKARTFQRNFVATYLDGSRGGIQKDAAVVAFVSPTEKDWRFSLVKMEYRLGETKKGTVKATKELTPAKRFSYLVGEHENSHTAQSRFVPLLLKEPSDPTLEELDKAFSVEAVTKEFFEKYRELFHSLNENLEELVGKDEKIKKDFESKNIDTTSFTKKLLGQIVFLYFLQKKGWFGVDKNDEWGTGHKDFLRRLFEKQIVKYKNYFNDVLENLFYEALSTKRDKDYYSGFDCKLPFLNGGLFDPIGDYDWINTDINLPDDIFSNDKKTKEGDTGNGILDVFDRYNFTVREDEPLEKEVAVDPEMLGKVFENLLEVKDRKSKGTYYTPREIVHYMCQQSLINYLATECKDKVKKKEIEELVKQGELIINHDLNVESRGYETDTYSYKIPESIRKNAQYIDDKLAEIKVCDPAIGSGAFPVGMMNEIVKIRSILTTYITDKNNRNIYNFKRHAIKKSLYGVDIDPGAVEIAKLRLWLSLIIEEEDIKSIRPLPNLDYKVVCGNSLLDVNKQNLFVNHFIKRIEALKEELFSESEVDEKRKKKNEIDNLIKELTENNKIFDFEIFFSEIFSNRVGGINGFDVVIANPPYIGEKGNEEVFHKVLKNDLGRRFYTRWMDYFYYFFHKALDITSRSGVISFITTNYFFTASGAINLRKDMRERASFLEIINFDELKIFEAARGQHNVLSILKKGFEPEIISKNILVTRKGNASIEILRDILTGVDSKTKHFSVKQPFLYDEDESQIRIQGCGLTSENSIQNVISKMKKGSYSLGQICNVIMGLVTRADIVSLRHFKVDPNLKAKKGDGIFILTDKEFRDLQLRKPDIDNYIRPYFKNSDIWKYYSNVHNKKWLLYFKDKGQPIKLSPEFQRHFKKYRILLTKLKQNFLKNKIASVFVERWLKNGNYFVLFNPKEEDYFLKPKIVAPYRSKINRFSYNDVPWFASQDVCFIHEKDGNYQLKYILSILNSKLCYVWLFNKGKRKGEVLELMKKPISGIPIKRILEEGQRLFVNKVDEILELTKAEDYDPSNPPEKQSKLEKEIDQMVYELYGLTQKEIEIVEKSASKGESV